MNGPAEERSFAVGSVCKVGDNMSRTQKSALRPMPTGHAPVICSMIRSLVIVVSLLFAATAARAQVSFTPLGFYEATGVSRDGSIVVGFSSPQPRWAYRWTAATGSIPMFDPSSGFEVVPQALSDDGSTMVGAYYTDIGAQPKAFRWTAEEGLDELRVPNTPVYSIARDVSADGSVVVGSGLFHATLVPGLGGRLLVA